MPRKGQTIEANPLVLGESKTNQGYTVFKNTDEELVNKIKNLKNQLPSDTWIETDVFYHTTGECRIEKELNETQCLCVDSVGHYFIKNKEDFADTKRENLLQEINDKFDVSNTLNAMGPFYTRDGYARIEFESWESKKADKEYTDEEKERLRHFMGGYDSHGRISSVYVGSHFEVSYDGSIFVRTGRFGGSAMFCYFNEDGNIENRDYNEDIKNFLNNEPKSRKDMINEIVSAIPDGEYENYGNKWYSDTWCFVIEKIEESGDEWYRGKIALHVTKHKNNGSGKYGSYKKPKSAIPSSKDHLLSFILPIVNEVEIGTGEGPVDLSEFYDQSLIPSTSAEEKETPKKRVQKTKINEGDYYDIYDLSGEEFEEYLEILDENEREEFKKALEDFSNGIDPGNNAEDIINKSVTWILGSMDLPSFSFEKGEEQPEHDDFIGLVKLPHGINMTFEIAEGDAVELRWDHSIYETDVVNLQFVE